MKDPCIRQLLRKTALLPFLDDADSKVVEELNLPVAGARIDVAVINGSLHGYEIKSASDTLQRLPAQIEAYTKVFDYLSIVTEGKYENKISEFVPHWIGIYICQEYKGIKSISQVRRPIFNPHKEGFFIAKLLWREELVACLTEHSISYRKKDRNWLLCEALASSFNVEEISQMVRYQLKKREDWKLS